MFKFINTNISLVYTIMKSDINEQTIKDLYNLLVGMMLQKVVQLFMSQVVVRFVKYQGLKYLYFRACKERARVQQNIHQKVVNNLSSDEKIQVNEQIKQRAGKTLFGHLDKEEHEYRRMVTVFNHKDGTKKSCIYRDQLLIDQVELNSRLHYLSLTYELGDRAETFLFLSFATLYSALCPIVSVIVIFNNVLTMKFQRLSHLHYVQRNPIIHQNGLGPWLSILEFLAISTVISNCVFLYMCRASFADNLAQIYNYILSIEDVKKIRKENESHDV